jgi:hypothetical protein
MVQCTDDQSVMKHLPPGMLERFFNIDGRCAILDQLSLPQSMHHLVAQAGKCRRRSMSFQQEEKGLIRSRIRHDRENSGCKRILLVTFLPLICMTIYTTLVGSFNGLLLLLWLLIVMGVVIYSAYLNKRSKKHEVRWYR